MRSLVEKANRHRPVTAAFLGSLLLVGGGWLWAFLALRHTDQPLILHFNNLVGIDQVGDLGDIAPVGFAALAFILINFFVALELEERDWFLGKFTAVAVFGFATLIFIGFSAILAVN